MLDWKEIFATRSTRMEASEIRELLKLLDQPDMISFAGGIPDPKLFPVEAFRDAYSDVLADSAVSGALQYSVSEGYGPLREWIANEMAKIGVPCAVDNIMITSGSQQALDYLGKLLISPNDTALIGWPTYLGALQAFNAYEPTYDRLELFPNMPAGDLGKRAEEAGGKVKFAYVTPDFCNPTGETMTKDERLRLIALAEQEDCAIIEDAAYQALRYDGEDIAPILALEIEQTGHIDSTRTIYCGSFSKTLAPGLRLGWVCAAKPVIQRLVLTKQAADLNTSTINQMVMARVAETVFEAQVDKIRNAYRQRRDAMLQALAAHMPDGVSWSEPEGGMFVWVRLPEGMHAADLLRASVENIKVAFVPGHAFFADRSGGNYLRLNFSLPSNEQINEGLSRLGGLIRQRMVSAA